MKGLSPPSLIQNYWNMSPEANRIRFVYAGGALIIELNQSRLWVASTRVDRFTETKLTRGKFAPMCGQADFDVDNAFPPVS